MKIEHILGWAILGVIALSVAGGEKVRKAIDTAASFIIALFILAIWILVAIALLRS